MTSDRCPKCDSGMEEGFLLDRFQNGSRALRWYEGRLERGWFGIPKTRGRKHFEVHARRCRRCGYLEAFAVAPPA